jgi:hypothetical protein
MAANSAATVTDHLRIVVDKSWDLSAHASGLLILLVAVLLVLIAILPSLLSGRWRIWRRFELSGAELGLGDQKVTLHPNLTDMQIAYKIWVELSTRKIGLPIDLEDDVVADIYDSWYSFFSVTRELIKDVPVSRFRRKDTEQIVRLSIEVLNMGIRPHLTKWQARFRRWYEQELTKEDNAKLHPQDIQKSFPQFQELASDIALVNQRLINYRQKMYELVTSM